MNSLIRTTYNRILPQDWILRPQILRRRTRGISSFSRKILSAVGFFILMGGFSLSLGMRKIRKKQETLSQLKRVNGNTSENLKNVQDTDCIIFFESSEIAPGRDPFSNSELEIDLSETLLKGNITSIHKEVASVEDLSETINTLNQQKNRIHAIFLHAHGSSNNITLSRCRKEIKTSLLGVDYDFPYDELIKLTTKTSSPLVKSINALQHKPWIVLVGCSTADETHAPSIARQLSEQLSNSSIIASKNDIRFGTSYFDLCMENSPASSFPVFVPVVRFLNSKENTEDEDKKKKLNPWEMCKKMLFFPPQKDNTIVFESGNEMPIKHGSLLFHAFPRCYFFFRNIFQLCIEIDSVIIRCLELEKTKGKGSP